MKYVVPPVGILGGTCPPHPPAIAAPGDGDMSLVTCQQGYLYFVVVAS